MTNPDVQPISLADHRASRQTSAAQPKQLTAAQHRAYRQLAITTLGLDLPTLTQTLRARRIQAMPQLRIVAPTDLAA